MKKSVDLVSCYVLNIGLLFGLGLLWALAAYEMNSIRFVGLILAVGASSVINLFFFIPTKLLPLRLLVPGIISASIFFWLVQGSSVERSFFSSIGIINGVLCVMWLFLKWAKRQEDK